MEIKVGDKLRLKEWSQGDFIEVLFVGKERFFGLYSDAFEMDYMILNDWLPYEEPKKIVKVKVARRDISNCLGESVKEDGCIFITSDRKWFHFPDSIEVEGELVE